MVRLTTLSQNTGIMFSPNLYETEAPPTLILRKVKRALFSKPLPLYQKRGTEKKITFLLYERKTLETYSCLSKREK